MYRKYKRYLAIVLSIIMTMILAMPVNAAITDKDHIAFTEDLAVSMAETFANSMMHGK